MKIEIEIPAKRIADLVVTMMESGGSNYWCAGICPTPGSNHDKWTPPAGTNWYEHEETYSGNTNPSHAGFDVEVTDAEEGGKKIRCDMASVKRAFEVMAKEYGGHFGDFMNEDSDRETADCFLQLMCFGKEVYA